LWLSRRWPGRRGEKVPAAVGTVANRFVEGDPAALNGQGSVLVADATKGTARRTRLLRAEGLGLLLQESAEGARRQAGRRGRRDLLQRLEIDLLARSGRAEDAPGDDFAPASGQVMDFLEFLR